MNNDDEHQHGDYAEVPTVEDLAYQMFRSIIQQLVIQCDAYRNIHLQAAQENVTLKKKIEDLQLEIEKLKKDSSRTTSTTESTSFDPCSECEMPCSKHACYPPEVSKEIDQGNMAGSVGQHRRHLCIGQSVPASEWPKDLKDLPGDYNATLARIFKEKKDLIGYNVKLTATSVVTTTPDDSSNTADWYLFPDQIKISNVNIEQIEEVIQTLFVDDQSVIKIKDKTKTIEEQLKQYNNLPVFNDNIECERLHGLWILVCCHYQHDQRCGVIGPMLIDEIEKYARETDRTDNVHWLKISHIGGHKFAGNVIVYPSGTWYGRVLTCHIPLLIDAYTSSSEELKTKLKPLHRGNLDTAW